LERKFFYFALGWTFLIAFLSLVSFVKMPSVSIPSKDKYAHFIFYFILTLSWMLSFKEVNNKFLFKIMGVIVVYGIIIEVLQGKFTVSREADVYDVLANSLGVFVAYLGFPFIKRKVLKK
jgi:VanZ family protein